MSALQITAITLIAVASLVGVALFARTVGYLVRVIRLGAPDPTRGGQAGDRARSVLVETLGHARLGKWPLIGIMHWLSSWASARCSSRCSLRTGRSSTPRSRCP